MREISCRVFGHWWQQYHVGGGLAGDGWWERRCRFCGKVQMRAEKGWVDV